MQTLERAPDAVGTQALAGLIPTGPAVAVLIPCYNEASTVAAVVTAFREALPGAAVYVYDNNSTDGTFEAAHAAGALVRRERRQGKGHVVRRMFADIEADVYLLVDGDMTYDAASAPGLVRKLVEEELDFVNGSRVSHAAGAYRPGHRLGNVVLTSLVRTAFGRAFTDMLSGYKVFSRRYVKSFPAMSGGFEIETELTVHALELRMPCSEMATPYGDRPEGSSSKLHTLRDGWRILMLIVRLVKDERPLTFFGIAGLVFAVSGLAFGASVILEFAETGYVPRLPTAMLSVGLVLVGTLGCFSGIILDTVTKARQEAKRIAYLSVPRLHRN